MLVQDPLKDQLLQILRYFRQVLLPWHDEDLCFLHLDVYRYTCDFGSDEQRELMFNVLRVHNLQCGGCFRNILARSQATSDPFKRSTYLNLYVSTLMADMKRAGGTFECASCDGVHRVLMAYPPSMADCPVKQFESVLYEDPKLESWALADVVSKELFENPMRVFEWLDTGVVPMMQLSLQREEWEPTVWLDLLRTRPVTAKVRWEGRVKTVAAGWNFRERYQRLVGKYLDDNLRQEARGLGEHESASGDAESALALRDIVRRYDGRVPFGSFAKTTLELRSIDRYRHGKVDALARSEPLDYPVVDDRPPLRDGIDEAQATGERTGWVDDVQATERRIDLDLRIRRLRPKLTDRESAIVDLLLAEELTDAEVAERLGVARETISRDRASIRRKAMEVSQSDAV